MREGRMSGIRRAKVSDEIVRTLRDRIHRGDLKPGDQLPGERRLAVEFSAGRGSVREALRALELAGFVDSRHGGGTFVVDRPSDDTRVSLGQFLERHRRRVLELSEARQMLETRLAWLAAERWRDEDLETLRQAIENQQSHLDRENIDGAFEADRAFHSAVAQATHSGTLILLYTQLTHLMAEDRRAAIEIDRRRKRAPQDHYAIYDAIARGDGPGASKAMQTHLRAVERTLLDALRTYQRAVSPAADERRREPRARRSA